MSGPPPPDTEIDPAWAAENNLGWILGVNVVFHVIALVFVCGRLYTRIVMVKSFGVDDALMIAAAVSHFPWILSKGQLTPGL
jgi:predicted tellurium resistance membrane protein TerC